MSSQYSLSAYQPNIQVFDADLKGSRELRLKYTPVNNAKLHKSKATVLEYIKMLWGHSVVIIEK